MLLRKIKRSRRVLSWVALALLALSPFFAPELARAYDFTSAPPTIGGAGAVCPGFGLTRRIVPCIKENIIEAVYYFLVPFSQYMANFVAAACTLAVVLWGALMAAGKATAPVRDLAVTCMKIGAVVMFTSNFAGAFGLFLDAIEDMLGYVASFAGYNTNWNCPMFSDPASLYIWDRVDCALETLVGGVFSTFTLSGGIVGFLITCLFSSYVGFFIAILGFYLIMQFLFAVARAMYIFISAYIAFSIMVLISPIFIPLVLFQASKSYFEKWLRLTTGFMLQPIFLFAYLAMLLIAFDEVVYTGQYSLWRIIAPSYLVDDPNFSLGDFLLYSGVYAADSKSSSAIKIDPGAVQRRFANPQNIDTGTLGTIGNTVAGPSDWNTGPYGGGIMNSLGLGNSPDDLRFFKVDVNTNGIRWEVLAAWNSYPATWYSPSDSWDVTDYLIDLFSRFIMAVITCYIFMILLDQLPFIGAAIAGKPVGLPTFGVGRMAPPGAGFMNNLRHDLANSARGSNIPAPTS